MNQTKLLFMQDSQLLNHESQIEDILKENDKDVLILNETIFYPQGGGQPYDQGTITSPSGKFIVKEVRFVDGIVKHIGNFETGKFEIGKTVQCEVDKKRRNLNNLLHSAGHLIDLVVWDKLGFRWKPTKGYHFPNGPYVEYQHDEENIDKEKLKQEIENLCNKLIQDGMQIKTFFEKYENLESICHAVPDYLPKDKPVRVVMLNSFGTPCGGTHVQNISEINGITIRKIKTKGKNIRISYALND